jgi:exodeoxyribonuclease VII small subunit
VTKPPKSAATKPQDDSDALTFEQALEQVESIIDRIERGEVGLEQSLAEYERGVKLIQHCRQIHSHAAQRVDDLTQRLTAGASETAPEDAADPCSDEDDPES